MSIFRLKRNDTSPSLSVTLKDSAGTAVDLSGATVRFHMKVPNASSAKVDAAATVDSDPTTGVVQYDWQSGDTDTVGTYYAELEVTYGDASVESFPNNGNFVVIIKPDQA